MPISEEIFHAYDIRGTHDQLNEDLARRVGVAMVALTGAKTIVVGRDMRPTSPVLATAMIAAIRAQGVNVVDIGMVSTSLFNFAIGHYPEHQAGIMVTASHNPAEYNGFKMMRGDALPVSGHDIKGPVMAADLTGSGSLGTLTERDIRQDYVDRCLAISGVQSLKGMKIVIDAGNGMAGVILPMIFERLDCQMVPMYFDPDGSFPNHEANPVKEETLTALQARVLSEGADVGIAFDGDADRIVFLDEHGRSMRGDHVLALFAEYLLPKKGGGAVIFSPNASWVIPQAVRAAGGRAVLSKVGHANIKKMMAEERAVLGGEVSGHFFFDDFYNLEASDYTMLLVLKILRDSGQMMSELIAPYRDCYASSGEVNFRVKDKAAVMQAIEEKYSGGAKEVNRLDGLRVEFDDWWFNVRPSNTEPLLRLTLEAKSPALLEQKRAELAAVIQAV